MKRMIIVTALALGLTACTQIGNVSVPKTDVPDVTTTSSRRGYELVFSSYRQGNTVLYYPQIEGLESLRRQEELNELIFEDAKNVIALFDDDVVCITVDYEIVARNDNEITIKYTGSGYTSSGEDDAETVERTFVISL